MNHFSAATFKNLLFLIFKCLIIMCLSVSLSEFILVVVCWTSWIFIINSFIKFVKFLFLNIILISLFLFSFCGSQNAYVYLMVSQRSLRLLLLLFYLFFFPFCSLGLVIFTVLSSSLLVLCLLKSLILSRVFLISVIALFSSRIYHWFLFKIFYISLVFIFSPFPSSTSFFSSFIIFKTII